MALLQVRGDYNSGQDSTQPSVASMLLGAVGRHTNDTVTWQQALVSASRNMSAGPWVTATGEVGAALSRVV